MISIFKSNQPLVTVLFPVLVIGYAMAYYFSGSSSEIADFGLWGFKQEFNKELYLLISVLIISFNAYSLNTIFNNNDFLERNTYVVGLIYIVGCVTMPVFENPGMLLFHFFDILSFKQLFYIKQNEDARKHIFNGSLLLAVGLTFFPHAFPVVLFPFFTLIVIRPFVWREMALIFLGLAVPFIYVYFYHTLYKDSSELIKLFWDNDFALNWSLRSLILFVTWLFLLLISFFIINNKIQRSGLRFKRLITLSWISIFLLVLSEFVHFFNQKEYLMISQVATTIIVAVGVSLTRFSMIFSLALYFLLLYGIYIQLGLKLF